MKKLLFAAFAALLAASVSAVAAVGIPPINGPALVDGAWLNGLAGGLNNVYASGISAVGTTQTTATALPSGALLIEVDTSTSAGTSGVNLPFCLAGTELNLLNNTAYTITVYPAVANNPVTAAQDTIITAGSAGTTSASQTLYSGKVYTCAKNGVWLGK